MILDPPYRKGMLEQLLPLLEPLMESDGIVICEHETRLVLPEVVQSLHQTKTKKYGAISVTTYLCEKGES